MAALHVSQTGVAVVCRTPLFHCTIMSGHPGRLAKHCLGQYTPLYCMQVCHISNAVEPPVQMVCGVKSCVVTYVGNKAWGVSGGPTKRTEGPHGAVTVSASVLVSECSIRCIALHHTQVEHTFEFPNGLACLL